MSASCGLIWWQNKVRIQDNVEFVTAFYDSNYYDALIYLHSRAHVHIIVSQMADLILSMGLHGRKTFELLLATCYCLSERSCQWAQSPTPFLFEHLVICTYSPTLPSDTHHCSDGQCETLCPLNLGTGCS